MKWSRVNSTCIRSGAYRISKYTLGGMDYYEIYHGDELIGDARDSNKARKVAMRHQQHNGEKSAIPTIGSEP
ncbi:MAG TPA: hypothetical protein VFM75_12845 [Modicisalibacter sp.]|nr:hypothetical protein [Modicisalibacter sp.]